MVGLVEEEVEAEELSDRGSSTNSDDHFYSGDSDDSDVISGDSDVYYGGYGHCYRCGKYVCSLSSLKKLGIFVGYSQNIRRHNAMCRDKLVVDVIENIGLKLQFSS